MLIKGCKWIEHDYISRTIKCLRCGTKKHLSTPIAYGKIPASAARFISNHKQCKGVDDFWET